MLFLSSYLQGLQDYVKGMKEDQKRVMLQMESWNRKEENEKEEFQHVNTAQCPKTKRFLLSCNCSSMDITFSLAVGKGTTSGQNSLFTEFFFHL